MISRDTTIASLLAEHPELVDVLAAYHAHFAHLRNRLLRKVMAPRVTVAQAARIAGVPPHELLRVLRRAVGEPEEAAEHGETPAAAGEPAGPALPAAVAARPRVDLDVRDDIRRGEEPFARIMAAVNALPRDGVLALRAPFEPVPLYDVLGRRGFAHWTDPRGPRDWSVWFYRARPATDATPAARADARPVPAVATKAIVIDVRGFEPPRPMIRVLERLETLGADEQLEVLHDRRPLFLYPQLDERGFVHETDEPEPGLVRIAIRRAPR